MHSLIHIAYADASERAKRPRRAQPPVTRPHSPPGVARATAARVLAGVAARLDRESARRVVA